MKRIALPTTALFMALALPLMAEAVPKKKSPSASAKSKSSFSEPGKKSGAPPAQERDLDDREGGPAGEEDGPPLAAVSSIEPEELEGFDHYAPQVQELIRKALGLTRMNLTYTFGSADPKKGGMDCSGTIYYLLHDFGFKGVPRSSDLMCGWVQENTLLFRVNEADSLKHHEFDSLQPGNLLFWSGTYNSAPRKIPVTHVMLYLGKLKKSGKHVVFGASNGRSYQGQRRNGVSVFDFSLPKAGSRASFYGYGLIPGIGKIKSSPPVLAAASAPASGLEKDKLALKSPAQPEKADSPSGAGKAKNDGGANDLDIKNKAQRSTSEISALKPGDTAKTPSPIHSESDENDDSGTLPSGSATAKSKTTAKDNDMAPRSKAEAGKTADAESDRKPQEEIRKAQPADSLASSQTGSGATTSASLATKKQSTAKSRAGSTAPQKKTTATQSASTSQNKTTSVKTASSSKKGSTGGSGSTRTRSKQSAPQPPTTMDRIRRAAGSFADDVKKTFR